MVLGLDEDDLTPEELSELLHDRPRKRGECVHAPRPCPWVGCKYHLFLEVQDLPHMRGPGSLKFSFPNQESWELKETCALDVADREGLTLEDVGLLLNITRERVRQIEMVALRKLKTWQNRRELKGGERNWGGTRQDDE